MAQLAARGRQFEQLDASARGPWPPLLPAVALCSALVGALASGLAVHWSSQGPGGALASGPLRAGAGAPPPSLRFAETRALEVLGELSAAEVRAVAAWLVAERGLAAVRNASSSCVWLAGPSAVELLRPPKAEALAYLDGAGPRPQRFARATAVGPAGVQEFRVGPLEQGRPARGATAEPIAGTPGVPYEKRPTEAGSDFFLAEGLLNRTIGELGQGLLHAAFGPVFPQLAGFRGDAGVASPQLRNNALAPAGQRWDMVKFLWAPPPPQRLEALWLHPVPLAFKLNTTARDFREWSILELYICDQGPYGTAASMREAFERGEVKLCPFQTSTGHWDVPQRESPKLPIDRKKLEAHGGVSWGPWDFTVTQRPSTGPALLDVKFGGERVLYELSLQDAQAAYAGTHTTSFFYSDAAFSLSMLSASLEPGVDCPAGAHFLSAANWFKLQDGGTAVTDPTAATDDFWPICIFEWAEDHTIWRHMQNSAPPETRGLVRKTLVLRSVATVGNYDYITDIKLREDGEIEVRTRFAGYIESRYYQPLFNPAEANFSTIVRPDLAGPVHSHAVSWKADIDVAGVRANTLQTTKVRAMEVDPPPGYGQRLYSKYLERRDIEQEGIGSSTFVADPREPGQWVITDRAASSTSGNRRGYAIALSSWSTTQVLPDSHPFVRAMPFTKYHLAVTRYHDHEYRVNSPYTQYDGLEDVRGTGAQDLDVFLADGEDLLDEDIVAWIGVGKEHIVRQEDLPLVSNFGVGFSLIPWNFFNGNMASNPPGA